MSPVSDPAVQWIFGLAKNGTHLPGSQARIHLVGAAYHTSSAICKLVSLATNDYVELYVMNTTDTQNVRVSDMSMSITSLAN